MSVTHLLQTLGIRTVPPVPPSEQAGGTGKTHTEQPCTPCSPRSPGKVKGVGVEQPQHRATNPGELLAAIAKEMGADEHMLRRLVSDDDMQDIAEGRYTRELLADYFKQMARDGRQLTDPQWHVDLLVQHAATASRHEARKKAAWTRAWKAAHEVFIGHVMDCPACCAPRGRYCETGMNLRCEYTTAYLNGRPAP